MLRVMERAVSVLNSDYKSDDSSCIRQILKIICENAFLRTVILFHGKLTKRANDDKYLAFESMDPGINLDILKSASETFLVDLKLTQGLEEHKKEKCYIAFIWYISYRFGISGSTHSRPDLFSTEEDVVNFVWSIEDIQTP